MSKRNYRVEKRDLVIGGKLQTCRVKVYRPIKLPDSPQVALPRHMNGFRDSTVGLGGNHPVSFQSLVLHELGANWFNLGGGGTST